MVSEITPPMMKMSGSASEIHVHCRRVCGLSSLVEYGTTMFVVDCVKFSVLVNQCVRPSCSLGDLHILKKNTKPDTLQIMYHFCSMRLGFVVSRYLLGTLRDSHCFLLRMLSYDMNQVYMVMGP